MMSWFVALAVIVFICTWMFVDHFLLGVLLALLIVAFGLGLQKFYSKSNSISK